MAGEGGLGVSGEQEHAFCKMMLHATKQYGVAFYDLERRITGWNLGAHFITGWSADEIIGQFTRTLFVPEDRARRLDEHEANTAAIVGVAEDERWHMRKDGSQFWSSGMSLPLRDDDGRVIGFAKVFRDATHLRARAKYLENEVQAHAAEREERGRILGTVAHEMRNPLSPLKSGLTLMTLQGSKPDAVQKLVPMMSRQLDALERLVEDLVDMTRIQTGKLSIVYGRANLQQLLEEGVDGLRAAADEKHVALHLLVPPVAVEVELDTQRFTQVVANLVRNAIKFSHAGGKVWLTATVDRTHLLLYLKDEGKGIAPDLLPKIFDAFTQARSAGAGREAGIGIGLSVVKEIVGLHQGTVEVRSEGIGKGTEFVVRMPLRKPRGSEPEL